MPLLYLDLGFGQVVEQAATTHPRLRAHGELASCCELVSCINYWRAAKLLSCIASCLIITLIIS